MGLVQSQLSLMLKYVAGFSGMYASGASINGSAGTRYLGLLTEKPTYIAEDGDAQQTLKATEVSTTDTGYSRVVLTILNSSSVQIEASPLSTTIVTKYVYISSETSEEVETTTSLTTAQQENQNYTYKCTRLYVVNKDEIHFNEAETNWFTDENGIQYFGIYTTQTGGSPIFIGKLLKPIKPTNGHVSIIKKGALQLYYEFYEFED